MKIIYELQCFWFLWHKHFVVKVLHVGILCCVFCLKWHLFISTFWETYPSPSLILTVLNKTLVPVGIVGVHVMVAKNAIVSKNETSTQSKCVTPVMWSRKTISMIRGPRGVSSLEEYLTHPVVELCTERLYSSLCNVCLVIDEYAYSIPHPYATLVP